MTTTTAPNAFARAVASSQKSMLWIRSTQQANSLSCSRHSSGANNVGVFQRFLLDLPFSGSGRVMSCH